MAVRYVAVRQMRRRDYRGRWFGTIVMTSMFEAMAIVFAAWIAPLWERPLAFLVILLILMPLQAAWIIPLSFLLSSRLGNRREA